MSSKIQKIINILTFLFVSLAVLTIGVSAFIVVGIGIFEYGLSLYYLPFITILSLFAFWLFLLVVLIVKRKNKKIINIVLLIVLVYFIIGIIIYFFGGEIRGISLFSRFILMLTVMISWPELLVGKIFFN